MQRDLVYGLIIARAVAPASKLATTRWWADTTLGADLGIADTGTDEVYAAMDWLFSRQDAIEKKLAARHLERGGLALFDLSSAWLEGRSCPLGAFGHSRDGKKNREQIEFGMVTSRAGIPVAIRAFPGNTSDSVAFGEIIPVVRDKFGLDEVIMVGDRGSVTKVRISQLKALPGAGWITALRAPSIAALASDDGPLQMSLFDDQNFAEITDPRYPGERLICCRNPALAAQRAAKRESLLAATEEELGKIRASVLAGRLNDAGKIGIKAGKVINKRKVGKHFITDIGDGRFGWRRDEEKIAAEAALDGIYVIRTSATADQLGSGETIEAYKDLGNLERDFWSMKAEDIDLRPIYHYLENRVRAHVLFCMLATYLTWHLRQALAPLTFTDNAKPAREDPVVPARRSAVRSRERHRQNHPGQAARPRLPRIGRPSGHTHQKHRQLRRETPRKTGNADPRTAPRLRAARQAHPAQPRRTVTTVPTNGAAQQTPQHDKTPGQHPKPRNRRSRKDGLDVRHLPCSEEERILRLAASLAGGIPVSLRDTLAGIDHRNIELVITAMMHAWGQRPEPEIP